MIFFKSRARSRAESELKAALTQEEIDAVRDYARTILTAKEFGHFLKKVAARRQELADHWGREEAMVQ